MRVWLVSWMAWGLVFGAAFGQADESTYREPQLEPPPFKVANIGFDPLETLGDICGVLAVRGEVSSLTQNRLMAVCLSINPDHKLANPANESLKRGQKPQGVDPLNPSADEKLRRDLMQMTLHISRTYTDQDAMTLAAMLFDICVDLLPDDVSLSYNHKIFTRKNKPAPWDTVLPESAAFMPLPALDPNLPAVKLGQKQSGIQALVVFEVGGGLAGKASRLTGSFVPGISAPETRGLQFNQQVGPMMLGTLPEIATFMSVRHDEWISGGVIEFSFQEKLIPKDGNSAGLASGLVVESLITGVPLDPKFACTGALNVDGSVQPIGGVVAKLRGAHKAGCTFVAIPHANRYALSDITLLGEASVLAQMQVFLVEQFDEGLKLATTAKDPQVQASLTEFAQLQAQFASQGVMNVVRTPEAQAKLAKILQQTPNHASAALMLSAAQGRLPRHLSLNGSLEEIMDVFRTLTGMVSPPPRYQTNLQLPVRDFEVIRDKMKRVGGSVDPRTKEMAAAVLLFSQACLEHRKSNNKKGHPVMDSFFKIGAAMDNLRNDPEVIEELEQ